MAKSKRDSMSAPISLRVTERDMEFLREESGRTGESVPTVIRSAIRAYAFSRLVPPSTLVQDIREINWQSLRKAIRAEVSFATESAKKPLPPSERKTPRRKYV